MREYLLANIFLKTLRDNRAGILGWGAGVGLIVAVGTTQYAQIIGASPDRQKFAAEAAKAFQAFSFLIGDIVSLDTLGGFVTVRVMGFIPIVIALWASVAAAGAIRGEEQTGALDVLLSTPHGRRSVLAQKVAAVGVGLVAITVLMIAGLGVGSVAASEAFALGDLVLTMLNVVAIAGFWGALALLVGHFTITRRATSGIAGGLIFGTYLLNNILGAVPGLEWLAWLTPFHYYSVSKPLVPGYEMQWGAWSVLVVASVVLLALASLIFIRRDIGSVFRLSNREGNAPGTATATARTPGNSAWLLGSVFGKSIRDLVLPTTMWAAGLAFYGVLIISTVNQALEPLREMIKNLGALAQIVGNLATPGAYLSFALLAYLPVLLSVFSITQIINWAEDEEEGRLEVLAAEPLPRIQLLLGRYLAIVLAMAAILAILAAALLLSAAGASVNVDSGRLVGSLAAVILPAFVVAAFGLCVATWLKRPGAAIPLTIGVVAVMFFLDTLGPLLNLPEAVLNVSVFHLYGKPLTEGLKWGSMLALAAASGVLLVGSLVGLNRRDIAK